MLDAQSADRLQDRQLLECFAAQRDEGAFAALVRRHGPLVLGVCRRRLKDSQEAEDAFQATFLVLARKAGSLRKPDAVASWLYGVAWRLAGKMNAHAAKRRILQRQATTMEPTAPPAEVSWRELCAVLDEELNRLPEKHRAPLLLCYLEGKTQEEAARQLGWPRGTLKRRLEHGRDLLRRQLDQRGVMFSAAVGATLLAQPTASATVPDSLAADTARAAAAFAQVAVAGNGVSARAVGLAEGALSAMFLATLRVTLAVGLILGLLASSASLVMHPARAARQPDVPSLEPPAPTVRQEPPAPPEEAPLYTDRYDTPLPYRLIA
jgi:RNA polymerase sigma factor (sigma-70 family)